MKQFVVALALAGVLAGGQPSSALVGSSRSGDRFAAHTVMVLNRTQSAAGFCTGVVIARDVVLTAAHCVIGAAGLRVLAGEGQPVELLEVESAVTHPEFRPDAPRTRQRSIDLALIRMKQPLPSRLSPATIDPQPSIAVGSRFNIAGYGIAVEGDERSAGKLREGELVARAPLSSILLWAEDLNRKGFGACTGDSGGPVFSADGTRVVAITAWSTGAGKKHCGALTQATLIAPQSKWIDGVLAAWGAR